MQKLDEKFRVCQPLMEAGDFEAAASIDQTALFISRNWPQIATASEAAIFWLSQLRYVTNILSVKFQIIGAIIKNLIFKECARLAR